MKYYLDTEFIECAKQRRVLGVKVGAPVPTIDLISIGLVAEDGRELYLINAECELEYAWENEWVRQNVLLPIYRSLICGDTRNRYDFTLSVMRWLFKAHGVAKAEIAVQVGMFLGLNQHWYMPQFSTGWRWTKPAKHEEPKIYGYYSDYDWVVVAQLFGRMIDLPDGLPMFCHDLKQEMARLNAPDTIKPNNGNEHNALADAKWNKLLHARLQAQYPAVA